MAGEELLLSLPVKLHVDYMRMQGNDPSTCTLKSTEYAEKQLKSLKHLTRL